MRSKADLETEVARATEAQHFLNHHFLKDTFDYLERTYTESWKNGHDPEKWLVCRYKIEALKDVKAHLESVVMTGRLADKEIANLVRQEKARRKYE